MSKDWMFFRAVLPSVGCCSFHSREKLVDDAADHFFCPIGERWLSSQYINWPPSSACHRPFLWKVPWRGMKRHRPVDSMCSNRANTGRCRVLKSPPSRRSVRLAFSRALRRMSLRGPKVHSGTGPSSTICLPAFRRRAQVWRRPSATSCFRRVSRWLLTSSIQRLWMNTVCTWGGIFQPVQD